MVDLERNEQNQELCIPVCLPCISIPALGHKCARYYKLLIASSIVHALCLVVHEQSESTSIKYT